MPMTIAKAIAKMATVVMAVFVHVLINSSFL